MEWLTTSTILEGLRDEDDTAWHRLVERFREPIIRFARRLGHSQADAEDLAQDTLLAFARRYRDGGYDRDRGRLSRWLFGIAYHQVLRDRRRAGRRGVSAVRNDDDGTFWGALPDESDATSIWEREWQTAMLARCLEQVRSEVEPGTLRAFEMVVLEQRAPADAAAELELPVARIYSAKHRVLSRMRAIRESLERIP